MIIGQRELTPTEVRQMVLLKLQDEIAKTWPRMRPFDVKRHAQKCLNQALRQFKGQKIYVQVEKHPASRLEALKEAYAPQWLIRRWPVKYQTVERG